MAYMGLFGAQAPNMQSDGGFFNTGLFNNWNNAANAGITGAGLFSTPLGLALGLGKGALQQLGNGDQYNTNGMSYGARALYGPSLGERIATWLGNQFGSSNQPAPPGAQQVMNSPALGSNSVGGLLGNFAANGAPIEAGNLGGGSFAGGLGSLPSTVEGGTMGGSPGGLGDWFGGIFGGGGDISQASKGGF